MRRTTLILPVLLLGWSAAWPQERSSASFTAAGYQGMGYVRVAPGQILHLMLRGLTINFDSTQTVLKTPFPTDFNGLSVTLRQSPNDAPVALPLLHGTWAGTCPWRPYIQMPIDPSKELGCDSDALYELVVQVPYELQTNPPGYLSPGQEASLADAVLTVTENGKPGLNLRVVPVVDQVHVIKSCDNYGAQIAGDPGGFESPECIPLVLHGDGSLVSASKPAQAGEELVLYAFGLGAPEAPVKTGDVAPAGGVPMSRSIRLFFPGLGEPNGSGQTDYVGLVGNLVGLYQINFHLPALPPALPQCGTDRPANLAMTVVGTASMDQVTFCAQP